MAKRILVTGGCGYIGSHTMVDLIDHGFEVVSIDNCCNASEEVLKGIETITGKKVVNHKIDLCDYEATREVFESYTDLVGVIHFAALKAVGESTEQPLLYFRNNLNSLLNVLDLQQEFGIDCHIFSSSCTVYGNATMLPVTEATPQQPAESPYGRTKQMGEAIIEDVSKRYTQLQSVLLRYFNPAGAHPSTLIGEAPSNVAQNLVPVITETAIGKRASMTVFGNDYDTRDGSNIRDFIHVMDLAHAHTLALMRVLDAKNEQQVEVYNLGIGQGVSVLEAIHAFEAVSGQKLNYNIGPRRTGDVIAIYADPAKAFTQLGWTPKYDINAIMDHAWAWEQKRSASMLV